MSRNSRTRRKARRKARALARKQKFMPRSNSRSDAAVFDFSALVEPSTGGPFTGGPSATKPQEKGEDRE